MALSFVSRIGGGPLGRAGVAIFSILALAGAIQFGLPVICSAGAALCAGTETAATGLDEAQAALDMALGPVGETSSFAPKDSVEIAKLVEAPVPVASSAVAEVAVAATPAVLTYDSLIASTFAVLDLGLTTAPAALSPQSELTSRSVQTVAINEDGTPVTASSAPAPLVAEAASETPVASSEPEVQIAEASVEPVAEEPEARASSMAYAPASGDEATVTGSGANVRSLPKRGGSDVLFALRGGEDVTIVEMSRGWAKIVDKQGRSGWIYGQYLNRN